MTQKQNEPPSLAWLSALAKAGDDKEKARQVFNDVRDAKVHPVEKDRFCRAVAQQSAVRVTEIMRGRPISEEEQQELVNAGMTRAKQRKQILEKQAEKKKKAEAKSQEAGEKPTTEKKKKKKKKKKAD